MPLPSPWGFGTCLIPVENISTFLARPSTLIQVASPNQPSVGLCSGVSSVFKTLEALFGSGPCEDVLCGIRGDSEIHLKGLLSPVLVDRTSLSTISLEFSSLALSVLWLESSCFAVYFLGLSSPPRPSGCTDWEKKRKGLPQPLWTEARAFGRAAPFPRVQAPPGPCCRWRPLSHRVAWAWGRHEKTARRERDRGFSPLSWAFTVSFLAPWPEGFSWRVLCPALRTTHGFQSSRSSGLGTERENGKVRLFQRYCESWSAPSVFLLLFALQSLQIADACILCRCDSLRLMLALTLAFNKQLHPFTFHPHLRYPFILWMHLDHLLRITNYKG